MRSRGYNMAPFVFDEEVLFDENAIALFTNFCNLKFCVATKVSVITQIYFGTFLSRIPEVKNPGIVLERIKPNPRGERKTIGRRKDKVFSQVERAVGGVVEYNTATFVEAEKLRATQERGMHQRIASTGIERGRSEVCEGM